MDETMGNAMERERKIKFGETEVEVRQVYPYRYDGGRGRQVLRIEASETDITVGQIDLLKENKGAVEHYEDGILKARYTGYTADFSYSYSNGTYSIELQLMGEMELKVEKNKADIEYMAIMAGVEL